MELISAREFIAQQTDMLLGSTALDPLQPADIFGNLNFFAYGMQPVATRNAGKGEKVGVVGAGDVWVKFIMPSLVQRGSEVFVYDKKFEASSYVEENFGIDPLAAERLAHKERGRFLELVQKAGAADCIHIVQGGVENLPDDLNYIAVLTPPSSHLSVIKQVTHKNVPIAVEKPLVVTNAQIDELASILQEHPHSIYCIDWQVMHALPVFDVCALKVPFADALHMEVHDGAAYEQFKQVFKLKNVSKIDARFVEGSSNSLGDIETAMRNRPELFDYEKGGGLLFDMAVHPLNVLAALGFRSSGIKEGFLGKPSKNENGELLQGVYERFGKEEGKKTGETYARAFMQMGIDDGNQDIETTIEAAKGAAVNDGRLILSDGHYELRWEMFPDEQSGRGSRLEIKDLNAGVIIATSTLVADCYALIMQDIANFVNHIRHTGKKIAFYLPEHRNMIHVILNIHDKARSQTISAGEVLNQLKLEEGKELAIV